MKIGLRLLGYRNIFTNTYISGKGKIKERPGFILVFNDELHNTSFSEISCLESFTSVTPDLIPGEISKIVSKICSHNLPENYSECFSLLDKFFTEENLSNEVRFAFDTGFLNLMKRRKRESASNLLRSAGFVVSEVDKMSVCRLIIPLPDPQKTVKVVEKGVNEGFTCFKLKTGRLDLKIEKEILMEIHKRFLGQIRIRTDSNLLLPIDSSIELLGNFGKDFIEYAEDPVDDPGLNFEFSEKTGIPYAIDLNREQVENPELINCFNCILILKPPLAGGIKKISGLASFCKKRKIPLVFSSLFESGIGILNISEIACLFGEPQFAAGIDTLKFFERDILISPVETERGVLDAGSYLKKLGDIQKDFLKNRLVEII